MGLAIGKSFKNLQTANEEKKIRSHLCYVCAYVFNKIEGKVRTAKTPETPKTWNTNDITPGNWKTKLGKISYERW